MRRTSAALALFLAACVGGHQAPSDAGVGNGGADAGLGGDGGVCETPDTCETTFRYPGAGVSSVELRGDFSANGWESGVALARSGDYFETTMQLAQGRTVNYKFVVDGVWLPDPGNPRTAPDGHGGVNSVLRVDCDPCPSAAGFDWRDAIMYFVVIDRFFDGDPANNSPVPDVEWAANYQGGDLAGLRQKIEEGYFTDLGVNVLWLTAPFDGAPGREFGNDGHWYSAFHGYWPSDLTKIDARMGTLAEMRAVVTAAHAAGIRVVLDYVMNHVHETSPIYAERPDWFWPLDGCICGDGCSWDDSPERERCWFDPFLPDFDFTNAAARAWSVDNAVWWAKELGIDGYRLDAVKHIETQWLLDLRARIEAEVADGETFYLVGETFTGNRDLIRDYIDPHTMLHGQFDFPLRAEVARVLLRRDGSMNDLVGFLNSNDSFYGPGAIMGTFIGNHDIPRPIHLAEDTPQFGEWDSGKSRAWYDRPELPGYRAPFERLLVAYALMMTTQGIPLIYYGDEIGMAGGGDPDNRRFMQWGGLSDHQLWLRDGLTALIDIRNQHPVLRRGSRSTLGVGHHTYVFEMVSGADRIYVALNRGDSSEPAQNLPAGSYTELLSGAQLTAPLTIPARSALILAP